MANNPSVNKRNRERDRQAYQREKDATRKQRRDEKVKREPGEPGLDRDIAGIVPGPQPLPDEFKDEGDL